MWNFQKTDHAYVVHTLVGICVGVLTSSTWKRRKRKMGKTTERRGNLEIRRVFLSRPELREEHALSARNLEQCVCLCVNMLARAFRSCIIPIHRSFQGCGMRRTIYTHCKPQHGVLFFFFVSCIYVLSVCLSFIWY